MVKLEIFPIIFVKYMKIEYTNFFKKLNSEETQKNFGKPNSKDLIEAYETETLTCINMH